MCDHGMAKCIESTDLKDEGRFEERYKCPCGATGMITGREEDDPTEWERAGKVFN